MEPKIQAAINLLKSGIEYQAYFFKKLNNIELFFQLNDQGLFLAEYNPAPIESERDKSFFTIPYWPVLAYLEKVSKESSNTENIKYAKALIEIIRKVTRPQGDRDKRADNYHTWYFFVKIMANLPKDIVKLEDIDLIADWLDSKFNTSLVVSEIAKTLLPKLLKSEGENLKKISHLIEIILDSVKIENRHSLTVHSLERIFELNALQLGQKCGRSISELIKKKIETIITEKDNLYCYMWRSAIEDHEQNVEADEYRHILIAGLRDMFISYSSCNDASELIQSFFKSEKFIIRRITIYVLDRLFDKYKCAAEEIISNNIHDLFHESNYHHEWYLFILHHFSQLSDDLRKILIDTIHDLSDDWHDNTHKERLDAMIRRRWLYAVKSSGYSIPSELEDEYFKGVDYEPEHPEFLSYMGPVSWGEESVFSASELLAQGSIDNIVTFLNNYQGKNRFGELALREAGQSLKEAVKAKQEFFESNLSEFKKVRLEYWYYILQAFEELWNDKKQINWDKVLKFCLDMLDGGLLWTDETKEDGHPLYPKKGWIPQVIADLIKKGVQNDEWPMPDDCLKEAENIIRTMLDKQKSTAKGNDSDTYTEAINSTKGRVLECFKSYVLRRYRIYEKLPDKGIKEKELFWEEVKPLFDREIEKLKNGNFEFSSIAGAYLPNLYYLNKDWVKRNINNIFPKEEKHWRCAMQGYSYVNTIYSVIYSLLKENGHIRKALDIKFSNDQVKKRIVDSVAISYLRGQELLEREDSLFNYLLKKWQAEDIEDIIALFWAHRDAELSCEQKILIFDFWRFCFNHIRGLEDQNKTILSDLNLLAVFLEEIDSEHEQKDWLMQSARYVEERYHSSFFLEYLDRLADVNPKEVGEIFLVMLDNKTPPSYKEENITSIVEKIYKVGFKNDIANPICNKYAKAGFEFLTGLYRKYNS